MWKELQVLQRDRRFVIVLFIFPIVFSTLLGHPIGELPGVEDGGTTAVLGFTVTFTFYTAILIGYSHYREHAWGVWSLVRASGLSRPVLIAGIVIPYFLLGLIQMAIMFLFARVVYGAELAGSLAALLLITVVLQLVVIGWSMVLLTVTSTIGSMLQATQMLALFCGAVAGGMLPFSSLPGWAQAIGRLTPQYWGIRGITGIYDGASLADVASEIAVLACIAIVTLGASFLLFDVRRVRRDVLA